MEGAGQPATLQHTLSQESDKDGSSACEEKQVNKVSESSGGEQPPARRMTRSMLATQHSTSNQSSISSNSEAGGDVLVPTKQPSREPTKKRKVESPATQVITPDKGKRGRPSRTTPFAGLDSYPVVLLNKLKGKADGPAGQTRTLQALHNVVIEDPRMIPSLHSAGVTEWLLEALSNSEELGRNVQFGALDVINCMIAVSSDAVVQFLIDRDVVGRVLPLCSHSYAYTRMQALWVLGNTGTLYFKSQVVRPNVIDGIAESYGTIGIFKGRLRSEVRDRYAETIKQLCSSSESAQFIALAKLLPVCADILRHEERADAVGGICQALSHLIDANGSNAISYLEEYQIINALIDRLAASKATGAHHVVRALAFVTSCCNDTQVRAVHRAVPYVEPLLVSAVDPSQPAQPVRGKLFSEVSLFLAMLCKLGEASIEQILTLAPKALPALFQALAPHTMHEYSTGRVNTTAANPALALMYATQCCSNQQLALLLEQGIFVVAFKALRTFDDVPNLQLQTLKALRRLVHKVTNIMDSVEEADHFDPDKYWGVVKALSQETPVVGDSSSNNNKDQCDGANFSKDSLQTTLARVQKYAQKLYQSGLDHGLVPTG